MKHKILKKFIALLVAGAIIMEPVSSAITTYAAELTEEDLNNIDAMNANDSSDEQEIEQTDTEKQDEIKNDENINVDNKNEENKDEQQDIESNTDKEETKNEENKTENEKDSKNSESKNEQEKDAEQVDDNEQDAEVEEKTEDKEEADEVAYEMPTELVYEDKENGTIITVNGEIEALNGAVKLVATKMSEERAVEYMDILEQTEEPSSNEDSNEEKSIRNITVYDLALFNLDGEQIEPAGEVSVSFALKDFGEKIANTENSIVAVYHNLDTTVDTKDTDEKSEEQEILNDTTENETKVETQDKTEDTKTVVDVENMEVTPMDTSEIPIVKDNLEELDTNVSEDGIVTVTTSSFSEYAVVLADSRATGQFKLDLGASNTQRETKLQDKTYFEQDKYLSDVTGTKNGQNTYNLYLEQALIDTEHPDVIENPAPAGMNVIVIIDQSSSMANNDRIGATNESTKAFFKRIKALNENRIAKAKAGIYTDIDPNGNVEAQMANNLITVTGIIGYNNHIYKRYRNINGLVVKSDSDVETLASAARLKNDLDAYLNGDDNADMQEMTRTDYALRQAETWVNEEGTPEKSYIVLMTDGTPTIKDKSGWHTDLAPINMSSENANDALRTARRLKDKGTIIDCVYIQWDGGELSEKAMSTGKIEDIIDLKQWGLMSAFLSLVSSDYPKNGTLGTNGRNLTGTFTYEYDENNEFGRHIYLPSTLKRLVIDVGTIPHKIDDASIALQKTGYASSSSMIQDVISDPFEKQTGAEVKVYKVPRIPKNLDENGIPTDMNNKYEVSEFRWGRKNYIENNEQLSEWEDITDEVSVSVNGNVIKVSGFDYEKNAITNFDKDTAADKISNDATVYKAGDYGYKLVVEVPINAKTTFGGNKIATNNPDTSYFLPSVPTGRKEGEAGYLPPWVKNTELNPDGNKYVEKYPLPIVDLNVTYNIVSDNMVIYAPQTAEIHNLVTDANNLLWYTDEVYFDLKTKCDNAKLEYNNAEQKYNEYETEYGKIENPSNDELKKLLELEVAKQDALNEYVKAKDELSEVDNYTPDGLNNQFVDIKYELKDPSGETIATLDIPHGKAYVVDENGKGNIDWNIVGGDNAIITKSGTYTINATITPVSTTRSPNGSVYTEADTDAYKDSIGYSSMDYSSTGSSDIGSQSALTVTKNPTAYIYQLKIKTTDSRLDYHQTLDFNLGNEPLMTTENPHIVSYEWVCTDRVTPSKKENEPGVTGELKVGSGVSIVNQIPDAASDTVTDIDGTIVTNCEDGKYVPVASVLFRSVGNINKSVSTADQITQSTIYMGENDHVYGERYSSVIWEHECDIVDECEQHEFAESQMYNTAEDGSAKGHSRYLIHVWENPASDPDKTTTTPSITKGQDIEWNVLLKNDNIEKNKKKRPSEFSMIDVLPWNQDERIDPLTNNENSKFSGDLYYKKIVMDFSNAETALNKLKSGQYKIYGTSDTNVRTADEMQLLGKSSSNNVTWTELKTTIDGTKVTVTGLATDMLAIKLDTILNWEDSISIDMTANLVNPLVQQVNDRYHNEAWVLNGKGVVKSEVVATTVTNLFLSGTIWEDEDTNGLMGNEEPRVKNVTVTLYTPYEPANGGTPDRTINGVKLTRAYDVNGDKYAPILTEENGEYLFDDIQPGTYYIVADHISDEFDLTKKKAGEGDINASRLDSEAEETFAQNDDSNLNQTAWIKEIKVVDQGVGNQNVGLKKIKGTIKVGKTLDEIYYPASMTDEEREDYWLTFIFKLKENTTGTTYTQSVRLHSSNMNKVDGKAQVYATFENLPLGTYSLTEISNSQYVIKNVESTSGKVSYDAATGVTTIPVTADDNIFEVTINNKLDKNPPGGDQNGVSNWINVRTPISLKLIYKGADPISDKSLTSYTFKQSDFEDIIVTYDDGTTIQMSDGTLNFNQITLSPGTVTNDMNSGKDKIAISGYYAERGRTVTDSFKVGVDLKPIHKFDLKFNANGSSFDDGNSINNVKFGYDENKGENFVIAGIYKDINNGKLKGRGNSYTFAGWNTQNDGRGIQYDSFAALNAVGKDSGVSSLTLYANWKTYVKFDAGDGGTIIGGSTADEQAITGKQSGTLNYNVNQEMSTGLRATKPSHEFVGWVTYDASGNEIKLENYGPIKEPVIFYAVYYRTDYEYTGGVQYFTAPVDGNYQIYTYGAKAGGRTDGENASGKGGYASGIVYLKKGTVLRVYVGGAGTDKTGGWNGGGNRYGNYNGGHAGGGATDIRLNASLYSRILVAGGGGGADDQYSGNDGYGGNGGGLNGSSGQGREAGAGGTQSSGNAFGYGGDSYDDDAGAGGGGYWGGYGASHHNGGGGGGSSYVSGALGCTTTYGYKFSNASVNGVNNGNGYARIYLVSR